MPRSIRARKMMAQMIMRISISARGLNGRISSALKKGRGVIMRHKIAKSKSFPYIIYLELDAKKYFH